MNITVERSLAEQLRPRIAVEERFARAGGKLKTKSFFRRHEKRYIAPAITAGLKLIGLYKRGRQEALNLVVSNFELFFPDLPDAFNGFRILQLSDFHIEGVDGLADTVLSAIKGLEADLCVLTGDYRYEDEGPCDETYRLMRKLLPGMAAPHGIYGILGNHDEAQIAYALEEMGVHMLINEAAEIERDRDSIWLVGVDDPYDYKCDDLPGAMASVPTDSFKIVLAHTPELYRQAAQFGAQMYLCGHTHGGQIRLPMIGAVRSNARCARRYTYRHWSYNGLQGYTSAGIGCSSVPVRLNCSPEIVLITLRRSTIGH